MVVGKFKKAEQSAHSNSYWIDSGICDLIILFNGIIYDEYFINKINLYDDHFVRVFDCL